MMTESPEPIPQPLRRWLRLSLRASMVLVLLVGGTLGYVMHRVRVQREAVRAVQEAGGIVQYDDQFSTDPERMKAIRSVKEPSAPSWLRRRLGDDLFRAAVAARFPKAVGPEVLGQVARLDGLLALQFANTTGMEGTWPAIAGLARLEEVDLLGSGVTDATLATLGGMASLRTVRLVRAPATDAGIGTLARLPGLRSLTLAVCPALSDAGVARLLGAMGTSLERFTWSGAPGPVGRTFGALAERHAQLRFLGLYQSPVEDADLAPIGRLRELAFLNLQQTRVTDAGLAHLEPLANLENLWINLPGVTDAGMKVVGRLGRLQYLDLTWSGVGDAGLAELTGLGELATLRLGETGLTDAGAATLARLPRLEMLVAIHTKLTDAGLAALEPAPSLKMLGVGGTAVTPEGIARFRAARPAAVVTTFAPPRTNGPPPAPK